MPFYDQMKRNIETKNSHRTAGVFLRSWRR